MTLIPNSVLDHVLGLQLTVAWAGEALCQPPRLAWWKTDLVDRDGGGDLFARLMPRTHAWAALQAVREAARQVDARLRRGLADPDRLATLFHFGFDTDERLSERLEHHKRSGDAPAAALRGLYDLSTAFDRDTLAQWLLGDVGTQDARVVPGGRELRAMPGALDLASSKLAAALLPLSDSYPLPFFRMTP